MLCSIRCLEPLGFPRPGPSPGAWALQPSFQELFGSHFPLQMQPKWQWWHHQYQRPHNGKMYRGIEESLLRLWQFQEIPTRTPFSCSCCPEWRLQGNGTEVGEGGIPYHLLQLGSLARTLQEREEPKDVRKQPGIKAAPREFKAPEGEFRASAHHHRQCHAEGAAMIAEVFHPKPGLQTSGGNLTPALQYPSQMSAMCHILNSFYP